MKKIVIMFMFLFPVVWCFGQDYASVEDQKQAGQAYFNEMLSLLKEGKKQKAIELLGKASLDTTKVMLFPLREYDFSLYDNYGFRLGEKGTVLCFAIQAKDSKGYGLFTQKELMEIVDTMLHFSQAKIACRIGARYEYPAQLAVQGGLTEFVVFLVKKDKELLYKVRSSNKTLIDEGVYYPRYDTAIALAKLYPDALSAYTLQEILTKVDTISILKAIETFLELKPALAKEELNIDGKTIMPADFFKEGVAARHKRDADAGYNVSDYIKADAEILKLIEIAAQR